ALGAAALLGIVVVSLIATGTLRAPGSGSPAATIAALRFAYFQFGDTQDTLWLADPANGAKKQLLTIPHGLDYGVVPSLSPDGRTFVYPALPPVTKAPNPDVPAGLWLLDAGSKTPRLIDGGADLLVK